MQETPGIVSCMYMLHEKKWNKRHATYHAYFSAWHAAHHVAHTVAYRTKQKIQMYTTVRVPKVGKICCRSFGFDKQFRFHFLFPLDRPTSVPLRQSWDHQAGSIFIQYFTLTDDVFVFLLEKNNAPSPMNPNLDYKACCMRIDQINMHSIGSCACFHCQTEGFAVL